MARAKTHEIVSPYYPPRARWYSPVLRPWHEFHRALHLERIHLPGGVTTLQFLLSLILPGYAFFASGRRILGLAAVAIYVNALVVFIVALGYQIGGLAFGLVIAVHATSIVFLEGYWLRESCRFGLRVVLALLTLFVVWFLIYAPVVDLVQAHWLMPLRVQGRVIVVQHMTSPKLVQRGDHLIYTLGATHNALIHNEAVFVQSGYGWGGVLAVAGDVVNFSVNSFSVNGVPHPLLPHMPQSGGLVVPEKHWFIWPELDLNGHGNVGEANISAMMLQLAVVSEDQYVGRPFKRWFFRRQILS